MSGASPLEGDEAKRLVEIDWRPSAAKLRTFGRAACFALPVLGWLLTGRPIWSGWSTGVCVVLGVLAVLGCLAALAAQFRPSSLRGVYVAASLISWPIGLAVGELMLAVIYFVLFTPIAFVFRLIRRDALELRLDRSAASYWRARRKPAGPESYFRQS